MSMSPLIYTSTLEPNNINCLLFPIACSRDPKVLVGRVWLKVTVLKKTKDPISALSIELNKQQPFQNAEKSLVLVTKVALKNPLNPESRLKTLEYISLNGKKGPIDIDPPAHPNIDSRFSYITTSDLSKRSFYFGPIKLLASKL